ncbi:metallophosphoesterase [Bradyrhizobium sp. 200]|uniref:metallophosphoesterase n=1 Tax=Bradyrhizobium sp. 200 TaxID=2782665 RepID=UPI001FFE5175|nr:metallophosphoesterase [Bradyrhizobium sp. 200]UPJ50102.1 metallophosphoesterase [Bradyrhizobium sp. 200]
MSTNAHDQSNVLSWVHFGDLHITHRDEQNYQNFLTLIAHANTNLAAGIDFAVLPGDNAEDGTEEQFLLVKQAIERLTIPLEIIPGDHDAKTGSLDLYRRCLEPELWRSRSISSYRCLFLNARDNGSQKGFGIGPAQTEWLASELRASDASEQWPVLFMHTYPSELGSSAAAVQALMRNHHVIMVDMGHTHYNEIASDGRTIYAATRSTGQIEEGPVGFSIANLDDVVVSWKFKPLGAWPFVMVTSPADRAFIIDTDRPDQVVRGVTEVRAKTWDALGVVSAVCRIDDGPVWPMRRIGTSAAWGCAWDSSESADGVHHLTVQVRTADGREASDTISALTSQSGRYEMPQCRPGDDVNAIGAYPEKGILGTQLGPNKNGRKW